jgi:hypothetical protein
MRGEEEEYGGGRQHLHLVPPFGSRLTCFQPQGHFNETEPSGEVYGLRAGVSGAEDDGVRHLAGSVMPLRSSLRGKGASGGGSAALAGFQVRTARDASVAMAPRLPFPEAAEEAVMEEEAEHDSCSGGWSELSGLCTACGRGRAAAARWRPAAGSRVGGWCDSMQLLRVCMCMCEKSSLDPGEGMEAPHLSCFSFSLPKPSRPPPCRHHRLPTGTMQVQVCLALEAQLRDRCSQLAPASTSSNDALARLSEVLQLQRSIQTLLSDAGKPGGEQPDLDLAACMERSNQRREKLHALLLEVGTQAQSLSATLDRSEELLKACRSSLRPGDQAALPMPQPAPEDVLLLGHRLRYTTFAHAGLVSQPPAPQQAQMLNSTLFKYSQAHAADALPCALTQAGPARPDAADTAAKAADGKPEPASTSAAAASAPAIDVSSLPPMPADWQPGQPLPSFPSGFQMPDNIPEMPPGWKPGDPIPMLLPAAGAAATESAAEPMDTTEEPPTAAPPRPAAPAVQPELLSFILNPDLEEADDYSESDDDDDDF